MFFLSNKKIQLNLKVYNLRLKVIIGVVMNMMYLRLHWFCLVFLIALSIQAKAKKKVTLCVKGSKRKTQTFKGKIISKSKTRVKLSTSYGVLDIPVRDIKKCSELPRLASPTLSPHFQERRNIGRLSTNQNNQAFSNIFSLSGGIRAKPNSILKHFSDVAPIALLEYEKRGLLRPLTGAWSENLGVRAWFGYSFFLSTGSHNSAFRFAEIGLGTSYEFLLSKKFFFSPSVGVGLSYAWVKANSNNSEFYEPFVRTGFFTGFRVLREMRIGLGFESNVFFEKRLYLIPQLSAKIEYLF